MTVVYALKDKETGLYMTKGNNLQELGSTTRLFKKQSKANEVAKDYYTYMWFAVEQLAKGKKGYRVDIGSEDFKKYVMDLKLNKPFEVVQVEIK